jgi:hypothetical protein
MLGQERSGPVNVERLVYLGRRERFGKVASADAPPDFAYCVALFAHGVASPSTRPSVVRSLDACQCRGPPLLFPAAASFCGHFGKLKDGGPT